MSRHRVSIIDINHFLASSHKISSLASSDKRHRPFLGIVQQSTLTNALSTTVAFLCLAFKFPTLHPQASRRKNSHGCSPRPQQLDISATRRWPPLIIDMWSVLGFIRQSTSTIPVQTSSPTLEASSHAFFFLQPPFLCLAFPTDRCQHTVTLTLQRSPSDAHCSHAQSTHAFCNNASVEVASIKVTRLLLFCRRDPHEVRIKTVIRCQLSLQRWQTKRRGDVLESRAGDGCWRRVVPNSNTIDVMER